MTFKPAGVELPNSYNAVDHKAIHAWMTNALRGEHAAVQNIRHVFSSAWIGLAYRLRAAIDFDDEFRRLITIGTAPPAMDRYRQETSLLSCVVSALSAKECFFMGAYAVGAAMGTRSFPLHDRKHLMKTPYEVTSAFETDYPDVSFTQRARENLDSTEQKRLEDLRNVLAHRGVLPRSHTEDEYNGNFESTIPSNPKALADEWEYATILNDQTTRVHVKAVCAAINTLMADLRVLAES